MRHDNLAAPMFSKRNALVKLLHGLDADRGNSRYDLKVISLDLQEHFGEQ